MPENKKQAISKLRDIIEQNLPKGFVETIQYAMIGYVVPHSIYPKGYHCKPADALPFLSIASQKNFIAVYYMSIYGDSALLYWFQQGYAKACTAKLDIGKTCVRFKKLDQMPFILIGELATK